MVDDLVRDALTLVKLLEYQPPAGVCPWCGSDCLTGHRLFCELRNWLDAAEAFCDANGLMHPARREELERAVEVEEARLGPAPRRYRDAD